MTYSPEHYKLNKEYYIKRNRIARASKATYLREIKSRPCADCNVTYPYSSGYFKKIKGHNSFYTPDVFELTSHGEKALLYNRQTPVRYARTYIPRNEGLRLLFEHSLMITDFISYIRHGAKQHGIEYIPLGEIEQKIQLEDGKQIALNVNISHTNKLGRTSRYAGVLKPDGAFVLKYPDGTSRFFFCELQHQSPSRRGGVDKSGMLRKLLGYQQIFEQAKLKTEWGLNSAKFYVLFAFAFEEDMRWAINLTQELFGTSDLFWFRHFPIYRETPSGFLVAPDQETELILQPWQRIGKPDISLYTV